ncbi:MAG: non-lysosomal glucosylceramidase [Kiritimatiellaeota bacterium]|nr:non-lysosomal glucosylceramidase [Kiritimatiellota bacterium]
MTYEKSKTSQISFPVGGVGAGCVGLAGNGALVDWEIFNAPNKGSLNGFTHFALRVERGGRVVDARVLHGDLPPPHIGGGFGPRMETLAGMPHFRDHVFKGGFPVAEIAFSDPDAPVRAKLLAWSAFIPCDADSSGRPLAFFEITVENTSGAACDCALAGVLANPFDTPDATNSVRLSSPSSPKSLSSPSSPPITQLLLARGGDATAFEYGELALSTDAGHCSFQEHLFRGHWNNADTLEAWWHDLLQPGELKNRRYETPRAKGQRPDAGALAAHFPLAPREARTTRFVLSWHVPNRRHGDCAEADGIPNRWKNYYAALQHSAAGGGAWAFQHYERLRRATMLFHDTLFASSLPPPVLDGISANLALLPTPVTQRLEDGTFYAFEGACDKSGCCEGSCAHVWNYAQALAFLFPELERSMRAAHYGHSIDAQGGAHFRLKLPLGRKAGETDYRPCVDGQFGEVMKTYREWKLSGRTDWLETLWPAVKNTVEYAWNPLNYDRWDPARTGVVRGRQHNTLDIEFFGPSGWLNAHYLGALKAAAEMAAALGDDAFAQACRAIFAKGKAWTDKHLFNGEVYFQDVDVTDRSLLDGFTDHGDAADYWDAEHGQIKYQFGREGRAIDAPLAQLYATLYGIGEVLDPAQTRANLLTLFDKNFMSMRDAVNPWRIYGLNDEKGVVMCTWPDGSRPVIPAWYAPEVWTGQEWALAAYLACFGETGKAAEIAAAIRGRYDGGSRNPWSEIECGHNYARSLASYAMLPAWSGFTFDLTRGMVGFAPKADGGFRCFWSVDGAWGEFARDAHSCALRVLHGELRLASLAVAGAWQTANFNSRPLAFQIHGNEVRFDSVVLLAAGGALELSTAAG